MCADIVAIGGGGFSEGSEPGIDEYLLTLCDAPRPAIGFIATASGDADRYLVKFYSQFSRLDCHPSHLPLFARTPDIGDWLQRQDIVFVGGGNTKSMLAVWDAWNLPQLLKTALDAGKVLAGISAGAICWFDAGVTDSFEGRLQALDCLGFISGSCCPHY
ncbi:MAG TPA: Type 1 glutamine amidotransferase-like domain-containing protein, partial [Pseudomonadales bacterium]|nr:Type 1 glutamine amidotransferase-like domain-containing protein [Pseudomonadales bacterium]